MHNLANYGLIEFKALSQHASEWARARYMHNITCTRRLAYVQKITL